MMTGCKHCGKRFLDHGEGGSCPNKKGTTFAVRSEFEHIMNVLEEQLAESKKQTQLLEKILEKTPTDNFKTLSDMLEEIEKTNKLLAERRF